MYGWTSAWGDLQLCKQQPWFVFRISGSKHRPVLIILHRKQNKKTAQKKWVSLNTYINTFTTGSNSVPKKAFCNSTAYSYKPYLIHGALPPRYNGHELSTTALYVYQLIWKKKMQNAVYPIHTPVGHHIYWSRFTTQLQPSCITLNIVTKSTLYLYH